MEIINQTVDEPEDANKVKQSIVEDNKPEPNNDEQKIDIIKEDIKEEAKQTIDENQNILNNNIEQNAEEKKVEENIEEKKIEENNETNNNTNNNNENSNHTKTNKSMDLQNYQSFDKQYEDIDLEPVGSDNILALPTPRKAKTKPNSNPLTKNKLSISTVSTAQKPSTKYHFNFPKISLKQSNSFLRLTKNENTRYKISKNIQETSENKIDTPNTLFCNKCKLSQNIIKYAYTCGHHICMECLIKLLLLYQFEPLENQYIFQSFCDCKLGNLVINYNKLISDLEKFNSPDKPKNCRDHNKAGIKFCRECELWLCEDCLNIHKVFNSMHTLLENERPLKKICRFHNEACEYFCVYCRTEICGTCLIQNSEHYDHKAIRIEDFKMFSDEVKKKLKYKECKDCLENLDKIKGKKINDIKGKVEKFNVDVDILINLLNETKENYNKFMNEKINELENIVNIIKNCYVRFYNLLDKDIQNYNLLLFYKEVVEILDIEMIYSNTDELIHIKNFLNNFNQKLFLAYKINTNSTPYPYTFNNYEKFKKESISKFKPNPKQFKQCFNYKSLTDKIYSIIKINNYNNDFAVAVGAHIFVYDSIDFTSENEVANSINKLPFYTSTRIKSSINFTSNNTFNTDRTKKYEENNVFPVIVSGHSKQITCLCKIKDNIIASGSEDKTIKIWNLNAEHQGKSEINTEDANKGTKNVEQNVEQNNEKNNNKILENNSTNTDNINSKRKCLLLYVITGISEKIDSILAVNDSTIIAGTANKIRIFNIQTGKELYYLIGHEKSVCALVKIKPEIIASGSYDHFIKVWSLKDKKCLFTFYGHNSTVNCLLLLKDGRLASGSGSWDKNLKIWNVDNKQCEATLVGHKREIKCIQQLMNGNLVTCSVDKSIKVWNILKKICIQTIEYHQDIVYAVCVLDKDKFVSGGRDQDLVVWKC